MGSRYVGVGLRSKPSSICVLLTRLWHAVPASSWQISVIVRRTQPTSPKGLSCWLTTTTQISLRDGGWVKRKTVGTCPSFSSILSQYGRYAFETCHGNKKVKLQRHETCAIDLMATCAVDQHWSMGPALTTWDWSQQTCLPLTPLYFKVWDTCVRSSLLERDPSFHCLSWRQGRGHLCPLL